MLTTVLDALAALDARLNERTKSVLAAVAIISCLLAVAYIEGHTPGAACY